MFPDILTLVSHRTTLPGYDRIKIISEDNAGDTNELQQRTVLAKT